MIEKIQGCDWFVHVPGGANIFCMREMNHPEPHKFPEICAECSGTGRTGAHVEISPKPGMPPPTLAQITRSRL